MASPIRLDVSSTGVVIHCATCAHWAAFRFAKSDAWDVAIAHEERVHPEQRWQRDARDTRLAKARKKARHAG